MTEKNLFGANGEDRFQPTSDDPEAMTERAEALASAFEAAGSRISASLARAAVDGETSIRQLTKVMLEEMARIALAQLSLRREMAALSQDPFASPGVGSGPAGQLAGPQRTATQTAAEIARLVLAGRRSL